MKTIKILVILAAAMFSNFAIANGWAIVAPFNHGSGAVILQYQEPVPPPMFCNRGILMRRNSTGEPVCVYRRTINDNGNVRQVVIEESPQMGGQINYGNGGGYYGGGYNNNGCPPGMVRSPFIQGQGYQGGRPCW